MRKRLSDKVWGLIYFGGLLGGISLGFLIRRVMGG